MSNQLQPAFNWVLSLFIIGCAPLPDKETSTNTKKYSIRQAFEIVARENHETRRLYTRAIVGAGQQQGLKFDENWRDESAEAGPLPALFLRGISANIYKQNQVPLGLFLGSDFPVRESNKFRGKQAQRFEGIRRDGKPRYFYDEENKLFTAMFPDIASAAACVSCHNKHPESPKSDWKEGDVMGATTWTYPSDSVTFTELQAIIKAFRSGARETYNSYITKTTGFKKAKSPEIGLKWPSEGHYLPKTEIFIDSIKRLVAYHTLQGLFGELPNNRETNE